MIQCILSMASQSDKAYSHCHSIINGLVSIRYNHVNLVCQDFLDTCCGVKRRSETTPVAVINTKFYQDTATFLPSDLCNCARPVLGNVISKENGL